MKRQLWLIYLEKGVYSKTIVGGTYSDDVTVNYTGQGISINIERFYESE